jgi:hypothetical protein
MKVKESCNRPGVAKRVPGGLGSQIFMTFGTWRWWDCYPHPPATFTPTAQLLSNLFQAHSLQHIYHRIHSRPTAYSTVIIQSIPGPQPTAELPPNSFQHHSLQQSPSNLFQPHSIQQSHHPIRSRPTTYNTVTIQSIPGPQPTAQSTSNPFQPHNLQHSYHPIHSRPTAYSTVTIQSIPGPQPTAQLPSNPFQHTAHLPSNPFQAHSLQDSYHPIHSSPTAYSTVKIQPIPGQQPTAQ